MDVVNLLIKPASSDCNLHCKYCFYHDVSSNREVKSHGHMKRELLEKLVQEAFAVATKAVVLSFQGGEPTLIGLDFYKHLIILVNKYNKNNINVSYSIQTNGILLDEKWCEFFKTHHFLVGISLDGYQEVHDLFRYDIHKKGSFNKVLKRIELLKRYDVDFNILVVVNEINSKHPLKMYNFFKRMDLNYLQFIPCLSPLNNEINDFGLSPKNYLQFLNQIFKLWYQDIIAGKHISIRYFDNLIGIILGFGPQDCSLKEHCSSNVVVESNGDLYPCDFYVLDQYKLGNINTESLNNIYYKDITKTFINNSLQISDKCKECEFYQLCKGGCQRHRQGNENIYCMSYYQFLKNNINKLEDIAAMIKRNF